MFMTDLHFRPGPRPARFRLPGAVLLLAALVLGLAGCSRTAVQSVYESSCGAGKLILTRHVTTHLGAASEAKLWIEFEADGSRRIVDIVKPRMTLYAPPTAAERYSHLRPGSDDWPVFVSPRDFTPAEYDLIRNRLAMVLPELDAALVTEPADEQLDFGNPARLSSTRYTDYEGFRRKYAGPLRDVRVELYPNGEIWCFHAKGRTLVGSVVGGGHKALLPAGHGLLENAGLPHPVEFVLSCRDAQGRTLASEFNIERVTNKAYEAALHAERIDRRQR